MREPLSSYHRHFHAIWLRLAREARHDGEVHARCMAGAARARHRFEEMRRRGD